MTAAVEFIGDGTTDKGVSIEVKVEGEVAGYLTLSLDQWTKLRDRELEEVLVALRSEL